jgi:hypothetical protein
VAVLDNVMAHGSAARARGDPPRPWSRMAAGSGPVWAVVSGYDGRAWSSGVLGSAAVVVGRHGGPPPPRP